MRGARMLAAMVVVGMAGIAAAQPFPTYRCGETHEIGSLLVGDGNGRIVLVGDSHSTPENIHTLYRGMMDEWPPRGGFSWGSVCHGFTLFYPLADYTKLIVEPGDDPDYHAPGRVQSLTWTMDTPAGAVAVRSTRAGALRGRFLLYGLADAPALTQTPGSLPVDPAAHAGSVYATDWSDGDTTRLLATGEDETGKRLYVMGAQFEFPHDGGAIALQAIALPGWNTFHHADVDGEPPTGRWYTDAGLVELELATRPTFAVDWTLVIVALVHRDGRDWGAPGALESYIADTEALTARVVEAFAGGGEVLVLYEHLWHSPTTTGTNADEVEDYLVEAAQWSGLCGLVAADPWDSGAVSIAEATGYATFDEYLDTNLLHVDTAAGKAFFASLVWGMLQE